MTAEETPQARANRLSSIDSANSWRRQASRVREHAAEAARTPDVREALEESAQRCDAQADWWLRGAIEDQLAA